VATVKNTSKSLVSTIAQHESELLAKVEASNQEALGAIESARADAQKHLRAEEASLASEVAEMLRKAEEARTAAFETTLNAAREQMEDTRRAALVNMSSITEQVIALFSPQDSEGADT
jgi:vacuolar-type H+-ATPase subunit H